MKSIGILGGAGPVATSYFYNLLIKRISEKFNAIEDLEYPNITLLNHPIPFCTEDGLTCNGHPSPNAEVFTSLLSGLKKLEATGTDVNLMYCNSVHVFHDLLSKHTKTPLINMVDVTSQVAKDRGYRAVGVLGSNSTRANGLYKTTLAKYNLEEIAVTDYQQNILTSMIKKVMTERLTADEDDIGNIYSIASDLAYRGAYGYIIGCTELSYFLSNRHLEPNFIDSSNFTISHLLRNL